MSQGDAERFIAENTSDRRKLGDPLRDIQDLAEDFGSLLLPKRKPEKDYGTCPGCGSKMDAHGCSLC